MNLEKLEQNVVLSQKLVIFFLIALPLTYIVWFSWRNGYSLSTDTAAWGQFGDFIGGILNPLIAIFAVYWLTSSILIQKQELSETRIALDRAQAAQTRQAELALTAARTQSLNMRMTIISSELSAVLNQRNLILGDTDHTFFRNDIGNPEAAIDLLAALNARIETYRTSQTELVRDIEALLDET